MGSNHTQDANKMSTEPPLRISPIISGSRTQRLPYLLGGQGRHV